MNKTMKEKKRQKKIVTFLSDTEDDFKIINRLTKTKKGLEELRKRGSFTDYEGEDVPKTFLKDRDIKKLKKIIPQWEETVFLMGIWEDTGAFVFMDPDCETIFCISRQFLEDSLNLFKEGEKLD